MIPRQQQIRSADFSDIRRHIDTSDVAHPFASLKDALADRRDCIRKKTDGEQQYDQVRCGRVVH